MWVSANITVIAIALLSVWRWRHEFFRPPERVKYALCDERGFAKLDVPRGWHAVPCVDPAATLKIRQTSRSRFVIVVSECRGDFTPDVTMDVHSSLTRTQMASRMEVLASRGPTHREVGGFRAVQYEIDASANSRVWTYLLTTVSGDRAFHEITCCAPRSQYDRNVFERVLDGFREQAGSPAPPPLRPQSQASSAIAQGAFRVH